MRDVMAWDYSDVAFAFWRHDAIVIRRVCDNQEWEFPGERTITSCLDELGLKLIPDLIKQPPLPLEYPEQLELLPPGKA